MAELSEADKRTLLGANYKEVLAQAEREGRTKTPAAQLRAEHVEKCKSKKFTAVGVTVVGALLAVSNFYAVSGPSVMLVGVLGVAAFLGGIGWYVHLWRTVRKLQANPPTD